MSFRVRILAGFLLASPVAPGIAADDAPEPAANAQPVFLALATPPTKSAGSSGSGASIKPSLTASTPPIGTQTVATREADGRMQVRCREVTLHDARIRPRQPEQQP